jgi:alpha-L-rhamnosidase
MSDTFKRRRILPTRVVWQATETSSPAGGFLLQGDSGGLIFDFGRELYGGVTIAVGALSGPASATLRVRFGESVSEVAGPQSYIETNRTIRTGAEIQYGDTGFRFLRLEILEPGATADLKYVQAISIQRDLEYKGSFRCSDERLNEIWKVGATTVHLCMQTALWDGIKRGRSVWVGDLFPASMVVSTVFGEHPIVPASLDQVRDKTQFGGMDEPSWMNGISSYSLWWIITQHRWYLYHGNQHYLAQQRGYLVLLLEKLFDSIDEAGCEHLDGWRFLDWATEDDANVHAGFQSLFVLAMQAAIDVCRWLGEHELSTRCHDCVSKLKQCAPQPTDNKQATALMVLAGFGDAVRMNRDVLAIDPLAGLTPFLAYPVLEARALADDYAGCLELIRGYWGGMLDLGATTYWEDFDQSWVANTSRIDEVISDRRRQFPEGFGRCLSGTRMSLCHGWSSGVTAWLSEHVLGVRSIQPGCRTIEVDPHLCGLSEVQGAVPTPHGIVSVRHAQSATGEVATEIDGPKEVEIVSRQSPRPNVVRP